MPDLRSIVKLCLGELKRAGNASVARQSRQFFKADDDVVFFGIKAPQVKEIEKSLYEKVRGEWSPADGLAFCDLMLRQRELEARSTGLLLLARYQKRFDAGLIDVIEGWLAGDLCNNWATTDVLCSLIISPLVSRHPVLLLRLKRWAGMKNLWLRRASIVTMVPLARRGSHLDFAYELADRVMDHPEDLMHKANGWMLREAGKTDPQRLEAFLLKHGPRIPRTTLRYAIEKFPPDERRKLLELTSSSPRTRKTTES